MGGASTPAGACGRLAWALPAATAAAAAAAVHLGVLAGLAAVQVVAVVCCLLLVPAVLAEGALRVLAAVFCCPGAALAGLNPGCPPGVRWLRSMGLSPLLCGVTEAERRELRRLRLAAEDPGRRSRREQLTKALEELLSASEAPPPPAVSSMFAEMGAATMTPPPLSARSYPAAAPLASPSTSWAGALDGCPSGGSHGASTFAGSSWGGIAFVATDIEGSTAAFQASEAAAQAAQLKHDAVLRRELRATGGLEVATEGDAFRAAFPSVQAATRFCVGAQRALLREQWGRSILRLRAFREEFAAGHDKPVYSGPRVRMGIHLAQREEFSLDVHPITGGLSFTGPGWDAAARVSDAAWGGQIVVSGAAWAGLLERGLARAGNPIAKHLGRFVMGSSEEDLYEVAPATGSMALRSFPEARGLGKLEGQPRGYDIVPPPPPGPMAFVAVSPFPLRDRTSARHDWFGRRRRAWKRNRREFQTSLDRVQQLFHGYRFKSRSSGKGGERLVAFRSVEDATRFTLAVHLSLLYAEWSARGDAAFSAPMAACAIHFAAVEGNDFVRMTPLPSKGADVALPDVNDHRHRRRANAGGKATYFHGSGVEGVLALLECASPGQTLLSGEAWGHVQASLGSLSFPHVVDLGVHLIPGGGGGGSSAVKHVVQILPQAVCHRSKCFPRIPTLACYSPGARDAPKAAEGVAFLFTYPACTAESPQLDKDEAALLSTSLKSFSQEARKLAREGGPGGGFRGYECQEVSSGAFMFAFPNLSEAISYATDLATLLVTLEGWAPELRDRGWESGRLVQMGIAYGVPVSQCEHATTGRADYFGSVINLAARAAAAASPGQILVALSENTSEQEIKRLTRSSAGVGELARLGYYRFKGIRERTKVVEVVSQAHPERKFGKPSLSKAQPAVKSKTLWSMWRWVEDLGELSTPLGSPVALSPSRKPRLTCPSRSPNWV